MPSFDQFVGLAPFIGLLMQTGGTALLAALFVILRPHSRRRRYFTLWGWAWAVLFLGLAALLVRYGGLPVPPAVAAPAPPAAAVRLLHLLYLLGKIGFVALLVGGTAMFCRGRLPARPVGVVTGALAAGAAALALFGPSLDALVAAQAPVVIAGTLACGGLLARLPVSRRSVGSRMTAAVYGLLTLLWLVYLVLFSWLPAAGAAPAGLRLLAASNSLLDLLLQVLLGFGMVLILMEDSHRELDDAYGQLEIAYDELRRDALLDPLTGCLDRRAFEQGIGREGLGADFGAVAMLDLDNLKVVNDTLGHAAGDRLLRRLVSALRHHLRPADRIYRLGGDEFLVLMRRGRAEGLAERLAEPIEREAISSTTQDLEATGAGGRLRLRVSIGCADYEGAEGIAAAIKQADREMYEQKRRRKEKGAAVAG